MKVLGIDPGYGRCGVAIVEKVDGHDRLIYSMCIETRAEDTFPQRLSAIVETCTRIAKKHRPDAIALEKLYVTRNQKTAMRVAEVRGALLHAAAQLGIPSFEYTPSAVKSAAAGFGGADKEAVSKMLHATLRIEKKIRFDDEYDAIAIAVTHLAHGAYNHLAAAPKKGYNNA